MSATAMLPLSLRPQLKSANQARAPFDQSPPETFGIVPGALAPTVPIL